MHYCSIPFSLLFLPSLSAESLQQSMEKSQAYFQKILEDPWALLCFFGLSAPLLWLSSRWIASLLRRLQKRDFIACPWNEWDVAAMSALYLLFNILVGLFFSWLFPSGHRFVVYWVAQGGFCLFLLWFLGRGYSTPKEVLGFRKITVRESISAVFAYICFLPWYFFLYISAHWILAWWGLSPTAQKVAEEILQSQGYVWWMGLTSILVIAPLTEEFLFRVFLYSAFRRKWSITFSIACTSLIFALLHQNLFAFFPIFGLGLFLNLLYEKSQCLWFPFLAHCLHNMLTLIFLLYVT